MTPQLYAIEQAAKEESMIDGLDVQLRLNLSLRKKNYLNVFSNLIMWSCQFILFRPEETQKFDLSGRVARPNGWDPKS